MSESNKKVDVDFNEALRRIAHTPKGLIDSEKDNRIEDVPPTQDDTDKSDVKNEKSDLISSL